MSIKVRINNLECRFSQNRYEIVKWSPNPYYDSEDKLIEEGFEKILHPDGSFKLTKDFYSIHESCFKNHESCYTIATLVYDESEGCCDLHTVGSRLLELDEGERIDFFKVYENSEELIINESKNKSNVI